MNQFQREFNKIKQSRTALAVMVFTFLVVVVWTVVSLLYSQRQVDIDSRLTALAKPLVPKLDEDIFREIRQKRTYTEAELEEFSIYTLRTTKQGEYKVAPIGEELVDEPSPTPELTVEQESELEPEPETATGAAVLGVSSEEKATESAKVDEREL